MFNRELTKGLKFKIKTLMSVLDLDNWILRPRLHTKVYRSLSGRTVNDN